MLLEWKLTLIKMDTNWMDLIRLACSSGVYKGIPLTDIIRRIAEVGYAAVEIRAGHEEPAMGESIADVAKPLKDTLARHNISVANIAVTSGNLCNGPTPDGDILVNREHIERIKYYARLARELDCSSLTISPGRIPQKTNDGSRPSCLIAGLAEITKFARGFGVTVGVAYGPGLILQNATDVQALFPKVRGLKLAFNTANSHLACETPCVVATELKHHIRHIHLADVGCGNRAYLLPGEGEIEWISFFRTLHWIGYRGFVTVDLSSYADMPDLAAKRAFYYLSNLLNSFKRSMGKEIA